MIDAVGAPRLAAQPIESVVAFFGSCNQKLQELAKWVYDIVIEFFQIILSWVFSERSEQLPSPPDCTAMDMGILLSFYKGVQRGALGRFSEEDPLSVMVQEDRVLFWFDQAEGKIIIQDPFNRYSLKINELGMVQSAQIGEEYQQAFPEQLLFYIEPIYERLCNFLSSYVQDHEREVLRVEILRDGLKITPEFHLNQLSRLIARVGAEERRLSVRFLGYDFEEGEGIDAGGLSRDYMDDLWGGLLGTNCRIRYEIIPGRGVIPKSTGEMNPEGGARRGCIGH